MGNQTDGLPGGFLANQTFLRAPYLAKAFSTSDLEVVSLRLPTYTLEFIFKYGSF